MNNNPSPGNKLGGLTTILEKSLGAAAKGGTTTLSAVYRYAEPVTEKGFVFMDTPGYDPGLGDRPGGGRRQHALLHHRPRLGLWLQAAPSIKLATNTDMYNRMIDDMDINCGDILDGVPHRAKGRGDLRQDAGGRLGRASKSEAARLRRQRIRALADRRDDVGGGEASLGICERTILLPKMFSYLMDFTVR